jgi:hypothetical protein
LQDSVFGANEAHFVWFVAGVGAWLGSTIPFLTVRWWLNRKSVMPSSSIYQLSDVQQV